MKVVADTNIYVSAIIFGGKPQAILDLAQDGQIELFISADILAETTRILRDRFHRTSEQLRNDMMAIEAITTHVKPTERIEAVRGDAYDDRILECPVAAGAETIATGDAHLLSLGSFRGIGIQRVSAFLTGFQARGR